MNSIGKKLIIGFVIFLGILTLVYFMFKYAMDNHDYILFEDKANQIKVIAIEDVSKGDEIRSFNVKIKDEDICYMHGFDFENCIVQDREIHPIPERLRLRIFPFFWR
jgi:hypothetical protein